MARRLNIASVVFTVLAAVFALLLAVAVPALAHHKDGHDGGPASERSEEKGALVTGEEDNDDNAHPSGKDRETNDGATDDEQGNSGSDPDDDGHGPDRSNGGPDKPGGSGGVDQDDQDGNNGCGNDDDFEDDNEGWCGKPVEDDVESDEEEAPCDADLAMDGIQQCDEGEDDVVGDEVVGDEVVEGEAEGSVDSPDAVLGLRLPGQPAAGEGVAAVPAVRGARARGGVLPFTGGDVLGFLFLALGLVAAGYLMLRTRRT